MPKQFVLSGFQCAICSTRFTGKGSKNRAEKCEIIGVWVPLLRAEQTVIYNRQKSRVVTCRMLTAHDQRAVHGAGFIYELDPGPFAGAIEHFLTNDKPRRVYSREEFERQVKILFPDQKTRPYLPPLI